MRAAVLLLCALLLSLFSVFNQVKTYGLAHHERHDLEAILAPDAPNAQIAAVTGGLQRGFARLGVARPGGAALLTLRLAQNLALFLFAFLYYRRLGIGYAAALLGLSALAWATTHTNAAPTLGLDRYHDLALLVAVSCAATYHPQAWLLAFATAGVLAPMYFGATAPLLFWTGFLSMGMRRQRDPAPGAWRRALFGYPEETSRGRLLVTAISVAVLMLLGMFVDADFGPLLDDESIPPQTTALAAASMSSVLPAIALAGWAHWPLALRVYAVALLPLWLALTALSGDWSDPRAWLTPFALIVVPGALCAVQGDRTCDGA